MSEPKHRDEEWLREQYWVKGKTMAGVASAAGVSKGSIEYWFDKHGIETRPPHWDVSDRNRKSGPWDDRGWLKSEYIDQQKSTTDIAEEQSVSPHLIRMRLEEFGIDRRSPGSKGKGWFKSRKYTDEQYLRAEYVKDGKSAPDIASDCGVSPSTIYLWLKKHNIPIRARGHPPGEEHPCWNGGSTSPDYGKNWRQVRRRARKRDAHTCQICGHEWSEGERKLDVHHITPVRLFDSPEDADKLDNLVTLCRTCHNKWEGVPLQPQVDSGTAD